METSDCEGCEGVERMIPFSNIEIWEWCVVIVDLFTIVYLMYLFKTRQIKKKII